MRKIYYLLSVLALGTFVFFTSCNDGEEDKLTDAQERAKALSSGSWSQSTTTTVPTDVDPTVLDNLTLTFGVDENWAPTSFSSSGAPDFFTTSSSSTWSLSGTEHISLSGVDGGVPGFQITGFSETEMTLSFTFTTPAGRIAESGRITGLDGTYVVVVGK